MSTGNQAGGSMGNSSAGDAPPVIEHPTAERWQAALRNLKAATPLEQGDVGEGEGRPGTGQPAATQQAVGMSAATRAASTQTSTAQVGNHQPAELEVTSSAQTTASSSSGQPTATASSPLCSAEVVPGAAQTTTTQPTPTQSAAAMSGPAQATATEPTTARPQLARPAPSQPTPTQPAAAVSGAAQTTATEPTTTRPQLIRPAIAQMGPTQPIASIARPELEGGIPVEFGLSVGLKPDGKTSSTVCLRIASLEFDLRGSGEDFVASFKNTGEPKKSFTLGDFIRSVPDELKGLELTPAGAVVAYRADPKTVLFGVSIQLQDPKDNTKSGFKLSQLPFVGDRIPAGHDFGIDDVGLLYASQPTTAEWPNPDTIKQATGIQLPAAGTLSAGFHFSASLNVDGSSHALSAPSSPPAVSAPASSRGRGSDSAAPANASDADGVKWMNVDKTLGPVTLRRVGGSYKGGKLWVLLDVSVSALGLTVGVDGLSVGMDISPALSMAWEKLWKSVDFKLSGLAIDYRNSSVEIGGAFLRTETQGVDSYDGGAVIRTKQFGLSAIGSYTTIDGHPSMFIYGVLDYPLGGPSFFFVTGLAAGFGYNRKLIVPPVDKVGDFPLIKFANESGSGTTGLPAVLAGLKDSIPPSAGDIWLAIGIKFTSFKLIDSFALLALAFGQRVEIDLLGTSHVVVPPASPETLAEVTMQFKASFVPELGELKVDAVVSPDSYILSKDCHLTGGFAMYCWFLGDHAGDFVQTLGGYHPAFTVPSHYPQVPRLGFQWKVDERTSVSGTGYFALTSHALMAGGSLSANYSDGRLKAWFHLQADFLIAWKPFHYDASMEVDLGASYRLFGNVTISVDLSVGLHIWGPAFAGTAHVNLYICSFDVAFGATSSPKQPEPLTWSEFRTSFLPEDKNICSVIVKSGLLRTIKAADSQELDRMIINAKDFAIVTNSVIPSTSTSGVPDEHGVPLTLPKNSELGIAPMALPSFRAEHGITITRNGSDASKEFRFIPIYKRIPAGLWRAPAPGENGRKDDVNGPQFVEKTLAGFEILPAQQTISGHTHAIDRGNLKYEVSRNETEYRSGPELQFEPKDQEIAKTLASPNEELLKALGFQAVPDVEKQKSRIAGVFVGKPRIGNYKFS